MVLPEINSNVNLPECASWNQYGKTIAGSRDGQPGTDRFTLDTPYGFFLDNLSSLYIADQKNHRIIRCLENVPLTQKYLTIGIGLGIGVTSFNYPTSVYVTPNHDLFIGDSRNARIQKWNIVYDDRSLPATVVGRQGVFSKANDTFGGGFLGVYVDKNDFLYISDSNNHRIMRFAPNETEGVQIAGTGDPGSASNQLNEPIFFYIDSNFSLFIADHKNRRIQKWEKDAEEGITVGDSSPPLLLENPRSLTMDTSGNMYIVDESLGQVIKWNPVLNRSLCILGCIGGIGYQADQLNQPQFIQFDREKNLIVSDTGNHRIKSFQLFQDPNCLRANDRCHPPKVFIEPEHRFLINTPKISRDKPIQFSMSMLLDCSFSINITRQWTIYRCKEEDQPCTETNLTNTLISNTSEFFIPPLQLSADGYRILSTVIINNIGLIGSATSYLKLIKSPIYVYFASIRTITITINQNQILKFQPVNYSIDYEATRFARINLTYYCRLYPNNQYAVDNNGKLIELGDERLSNLNYRSCLNKTDFTYDDDVRKHSLMIDSTKLKSGQIYEFKVNFSNGYLGSILVEVTSIESFISVAVKCALNRCPIVNEYYLINTDTQTIFHSFCFENCLFDTVNIQWIIYGGISFTTNQSIDWSLFEINNNNELVQGIFYENVTIHKELFIEYPNVEYLYLRVFYNGSESSGTAMAYLKLNRPPKPGNCSIWPLIGDTSTVFNIQCQGWTDEDQIQDYTVLVSSLRYSIGTFISSQFQVNLPSGDEKLNFQIDLFIQIRDTYQSTSEFSFSSIIKVTPDIRTINDYIANSLKDDKHHYSQILLEGNQINTSQLILSISSVMEYISFQQIDQLLSSDPKQNLMNFYISSIDESRISRSEQHSNLTLIEYEKKLNERTNIREKLLIFYCQNYPKTIDQIILISSVLNKLTSVTSELSRSALEMTSKKCYQLSEELEKLTKDISFEQVQQAATHIYQCTSNTLTAINSILQQRSPILDKDLNDDNLYPDLDLFNKTMKNIFYQKKYTEKIQFEYEKTISILREALQIHLNINQQLNISTPKISIILKKLNPSEIIDQTLYLSSNSFIHIFNYSKQITNHSKSFIIQGILRPLANHGQNGYNLRYSNGLSISIVDDQGKNISVSNKFEFLIPRDVNIPIPSFIEENLTRSNKTYKINLNQSDENLTYSFHFEFKSFDFNLAYIIIYKFNSIPQFNSTDGRIVFCPYNNNTIHTLFINNIHTKDHQWIGIHIIELNDNEKYESCQLNKTLNSIFNRQITYSIKYQFRYYTSICYFLDEDNYWKTDGLEIGPKSNINQTQCFANHI